METYLIVKAVHVVSATILFGTGIGIAFFFFLPHVRREDAAARLAAARTTVVADFLFTLPAAIMQPLTGLWLVWQGGYGWDERWLVLTYILYAVAGACWIPVVFIQLALKRLAEAEHRGEGIDPVRYRRLFRLWFALGWPAFAGLVVVFFLMVAKPQ